MHSPTEVLEDKRRIVLRAVWPLCLLAMLVYGCSAPRGAFEGSSATAPVYIPGQPNFSMEAISTLRDEQTGLDLYLSLPQMSLSFIKQGEGFVGAYETVLQVRDRVDQMVVYEIDWRDTVRVETNEETQVYEPLRSHHRVGVPPGQYIIECTVEDLFSRTTAVRRQGLTVFPLQNGPPALSRIRLEGKRQGEAFSPIVNLHIPNNLDSLRAVVELYNADEEEYVDVRLVLLRFRTDNSVAIQPYWITPMFGSLEYRGVKFGREDTIQVTGRTLRGVAEEVVLEFNLPDLDDGIYRMFVDAGVPSVGEETDENLRALLHRERDLSVKGHGFPHVQTLDQLIESLAYIAYNREIDEILEAATPEQRRARFEQFWADLGETEEVTTDLIQQYYSRVEDANLLFTSYKEGWKTDRGMVYVVLGAPLYVENTFDTQIWYYAYNDNDPRHTFVFRRIRSSSINPAFHNYVLARQPYYERIWVRAVDRWRSGTIL